MSSAGRAASSSGCVARPRGRETGLTGYAEQIQRSLPTGSSAMETAEHREPYESRGSRTDLGAPGGESPPGDSTSRATASTSEPWTPTCERVKKLKPGWISGVRPSRGPLHGLLRMRFILDAVTTSLMLRSALGASRCAGRPARRKW